MFKTFPKTLVKASPLDTFLGIGLNKEDSRAWNEETWRGTNLLGDILTKVRDKLIAMHLNEGTGITIFHNCQHSFSSSELKAHFSHFELLL